MSDAAVIIIVIIIQALGYFAVYKLGYINGGYAKFKESIEYIREMKETQRMDDLLRDDLKPDSYMLKDSTAPEGTTVECKDGFFVFANGLWHKL